MRSFSQRAAPRGNPAEITVCEMRRSFRFVLIIGLSLAVAPCFALQSPDEEYENVAEEYIKGYLAARPLQGTAMGLHEYDGKITDFSRLALDAELARLRRFDDRLRKFDLNKLSTRQSIDLRILQAAIRKELFQRQEMSIYERNPMVYARAADLNVYIMRNFAPLEDRVRSIVAIELQVPNIIIAAKTNLNQVLPKPYVELAIQIAKASADFLRTNLVTAISELKDERIRADFVDSNRKAAAALSDYAGWLERERLPKSNARFRDWRGQIPADAGRHRAGQSHSGKSPGNWNGPVEFGTENVRFSRKRDRSRQTGQ